MNYFDSNDEAQNIKQRAVRAAGAVVFSRFAVNFINTFSVVILARLVAPGDFGLVAMVTAPFMVLLDFGNLGLSEATIQNEDIDHKQISTLFWINVVLSMTLAGLLMVLSPLVAAFYKENRLQSVTIAIALTFILGGLSTQHLALLRRKMQFFRITAIEITASITSVVAAIALAWRGWGYWAIVARQVVSSLTITAGAWVMCRWRPGLPASNAGIAPMVRFGLHFLGSNTIYYFTKNLDKVLLGWRHGSQELGYYDRAYHLFSLPLNQLIFPLGSVAFSSLSRLRRDPVQFTRYYLHSLSTLALIGMPLGAMLFLVSRDLILLLLGPQWEQSGRLFSIFSLSIGTSVITMTSGWLNLSLGRADRQMKLTIFTAIVTTLFYFIGLPFGSPGVAIAFSISPYLLLVPSLWYSGRPIDLRLSLMISVIWKYFVSAFIAGAMTWYLFFFLQSSAHMYAGLNIVVRIILSSTVCFAIYLILIVLFHQSTAPISQFISLLRDMVPASRSKAKDM